MSNIDSSTNDCESFKEDLKKSNNLLIDKINIILTSLLEENKFNKNYKEKIGKQKKIIFYSNEIPSISIKDYLNRILSFTDIEDNTLILSLIYIDKICEKNSIILSEHNIHRILFSSILISIKFNEDIYYKNKFYAKVAGVSAKELKKMESEFLRLIDFDLCVNDNLFVKYKKFINKIKFYDKRII